MLGTGEVGTVDTSLPTPSEPHDPLLFLLFWEVQRDVEGLVTRFIDKEDDVNLK